MVVNASHIPTGVMSEPDQPPTPDRLIDFLENGDNEEAMACLDRLEGADEGTRKRVLRAVRNVADERPAAVDGFASSLGTFLTDESRAVRLTTAKLFGTLAQSDPAIVLSEVDSLAERLADDEEFYYVRARCAEALGYMAVEAPEKVTDPETLADLRVGLSFDESEVKEKLAKALAYVALGDPSRLRYHVSSLAEHLDTERDLVRYHLCTALVVVGCEYPERLSEAADELRDRVDDENPYVRGRAVEGLALIVRSDASIEPVPALDEVGSVVEDPPVFLTDRVEFLRKELADDETSVETPAGLGTAESIRDETDDIVKAITSPDGSECPHCGLELSKDGPPMCPRCGAPHGYF